MIYLHDCTIYRNAAIDIVKDNITGKPDGLELCSLLLAVLSHTSENLEARQQVGEFGYLPSTVEKLIDLEII